MASTGQWGTVTALQLGPGTIAWAGSGKGAGGETTGEGLGDGEKPSGGNCRATEGGGGSLAMSGSGQGGAVTACMTMVVMTNPSRNKFGTLSANCGSNLSGKGGGRQ